MACFLVPAAEAVIVTVAKKIAESKEAKKSVAAPLPDASAEAPEISASAKAKNPFVKKLRWLSNLLWGGSVLLMFEHIWHGEVVPWFPFLTAASDPAEAADMLHEMATAGVSMAVLVTIIWLIMVGVSTAIEKRGAFARKDREVS